MTFKQKNFDEAMEWGERVWKDLKPHIDIASNRFIRVYENDEYKRREIDEQEIILILGIATRSEAFKAIVQSHLPFYKKKFDGIKK